MKLRFGTPEEAGMSVERIQHIVDLAEGWMAQGVTPALVILVARRGVIVLHEAFSRLAQERDSAPLELGSIFPLASLTKPITATAAMVLVEDGLLGLNRPVSWYIPEFVGEGKKLVMVHHLLTHTSGLRQEALDKYAQQKKSAVGIPPPPDDTIPTLAHEYLFLRYDAPLQSAPGIEMSYCSYGYNLVGEIVRRVSGRSLDEFARERIFGPLGMNDTHYIAPDSERHRMVKRPADTPFPWLGTMQQQETYYASGGACSTVMDMAIFGQMFLNCGAYGDARILSPASVSAMTRNQIPGISARYGEQFFPEASWGFGWSTNESKRCIAYAEPLQSPKAFCHGGLGGVFLWVDPVHEIVGIYFSISSRGGVPSHMLVPDMFGKVEFMGRMDMMINAVTAAIVD